MVVPTTYVRKEAALVVGYIKSMKCEPCISNIDGFHIALLEIAVHFSDNNAGRESVRLMSARV